MPKKPLIAGNWKMNPLTLNEAEVLFNSIKKQTKREKNTEIVICPPFIYLANIKKLLNSNIKLGAQDCFLQEKGAFTGEVSPKMLKNIGCNYVILGHSERRTKMEEKDEIILEKLKSALKFNLNPILCIGERKEEKKEGDTFEVLREQIKNSIGKLSNSKARDVIIAYEPVWAIGTGDNCPPNEAMTVLMFIKKQLMKIISKKAAEKNLILYGGSVNSNNAKCYMEAGFDGLLVGGSSLKPGDFAKIIKDSSKKD